MSFPVLVQSFKMSYEHYHGRRPRLSPSHETQLRKLAEKLRTLKIDPEQFVQVSFNLWADWCEERNMPPVPINVLCSEAAIERFAKLNPVSEQEYQMELVVNAERMVATYGVRNILDGKSPEEVQAEIDGEMRQFIPDWWYRLRDENTALYQRARKIAMKDVAWFFSVEYEDGDTYPDIAERTARKWHEYIA